MAEDPSVIAKEAKALQQLLKESIVLLDPWDKEVELHRRKLQKLYLILLLNNPFAKESRDAETHLWMQTSYALITSYKQRIAGLEQTLRETGTQRQQGRQQHHGPVEYRKLLQRFKQFLANEEKFWTQLVVRLRRHFSLSEADGALAALGIEVAEDSASGHDGVNADTKRGPKRPSHFQFPAQSAEPSPRITPTQHANCLATLSKALICLGDLARYREQYSEANNRRQDDPAKRGGRNIRARQTQISAEAKSKTYEKARACYERARNLVPNEGNASHQLAILASYQKDTFESLVHYYRAFCVQVSYEPASENMGTVLAKFLRSWRSRHARRQNTQLNVGESSSQPKDRVYALKDNIAALHALWREGNDELISMTSDLGHSIVADFANLVSERVLSVDMITKVIVLAQGALCHWIRAQSRKASAAISLVSCNLEPHILIHLLDLYRALFEVGLTELEESCKIGEEDLAMHITAVFRRTLPALRLAGKWLRVESNLESIVAARHNTSITTLSTTASSFFDSYTVFAARLAAVFPPTQLPPLHRPLEEDADFAGFLPLGGQLLKSEKLNGVGDERFIEQVHPNEEQLMRIWDIWHDASLVLGLANAHLNSFRPRSENEEAPKTQTDLIIEPFSPTHRSSGSKGVSPLRRHIDNRTRDDDDPRTEITKTDDDLIGDAFRAALGTDADDEEDEIVWNPRPSNSVTSPSLSNKARIMTPSPTANSMAAPSIIQPTTKTTLGQYGAANTINTSPFHNLPGPVLNPLPNSPKTTAEDLLANVLGNRTPASRPRRVSQVSPTASFVISPFSSPIDSNPYTQSQLLFGVQSPATTFGSGHSIWSASPDEGSLAAHHRHHSLSGPFAISGTHLMNQQQLWTGANERFQTQTVGNMMGTIHSGQNMHSQNMARQHALSPASLPMPASDTPSFSNYNQTHSISQVMKQDQIGNIGDKLPSMLSNMHLSSTVPLYASNLHTGTVPNTQIRRSTMTTTEPTFNSRFQPQNIGDIWGSTG